MPDDDRPLSHRAQEVLRRADEQLPNVRDLRLARPAAPGTTALIERVEVELSATRAHLEALDAAVAQLARELGIGERR